LSGADPALQEELGLEKGAEGFSYLGNRDTTSLSDEHSFDDAEAFQETIKCLKSIGLSQAEQTGVFRIVAAVLHLGNIQFEERGASGSDFGGQCEHAQITESSKPSLTKACELLGLDQEQLSKAILTKSLTVNGKTIQKQQSVAMAEDKRDALAKMTYSCLFLWLVQCVNETLNQFSKKKKGRAHSDTEQVGFIGVLDIYGFECFDTNGFEQLLINYCNEKLQRHFNRHLFEVEQQIYLNEGVDWSYIHFNDNRPCLELIEGGNGTVGILNTLDDAWGGMGSVAEKDVKFVAHLHKLFGSGTGMNDSSRTLDPGACGHANFVTPKVSSDKHFVVIHYAGKVRYNCFIGLFDALVVIARLTRFFFVFSGSVHR